MVRCEMRQHLTETVLNELVAKPALFFDLSGFYQIFLQCATVILHFFRKALALKGTLASQICCYCAVSSDFSRFLIAVSSRADIASRSIFC